jgi:imidazolonepropionase-like amidohydrolase
MNRETILPGQTVVVEKGRIIQVGESREVVVPADAIVVDGRGRYLMPGLVDMHTHTWGEADFFLFLANGVTTIRNMWGSGRQLAWRKRIAEGTLLGPTIYTTGPLIDGEPPIWNTSKVIASREQAEEEIARESELGYDFVKVYNRLSLPVYEAIVASAKKHGMRVTGHVPEAVGLERALKAGQTIEHLTGYIDAVQADYSPVKGQSVLQLRLKKIDFIDENKIPRMVDATVAANAWNCVTLIVNTKFVPAEEARELLWHPSMRFVTPGQLASWDPTKDFRLRGSTREDFERRRKEDAFRRKLVGLLHHAGAHILLGTDTPNPFVVPGFSIHEELQNLVDAGLSPYEAIRAGTKDAAEFLGASNEFGVVEVGKRADLILVEANPLESVRNVSRRAGVMVRGRWFAEAELLRMLEGQVASYTVSEQRLAGSFDPSFADAGSHSIRRYKVKSTDTLLGEERLRLEPSPTGFAVSSQQLINTPPRIDKFSMRLESDEDWKPGSLSLESSTSEGSTRVKMRKGGGKVTVDGNLPSGADLKAQVDAPDDSLFGCPLLASYLAVVKRLRSVGIGETIGLKMLTLEIDPDFDLIEANLQVERQADSEKRGRDGRDRPVRVFAIKDTRNNATYADVIFVDQDDTLVSYERVGQMSLLHYELVENSL